MTTLLLPVQCCCEPGKRLGWVMVPKPVGRAVHFLVNEPPAGRWPGNDPRQLTSTLSTHIDLHVSTPFPAVPYECPAKPGVYHLTIPLQLKRLRC